MTRLLTEGKFFFLLHMLLFENKAKTSKKLSEQFVYEKESQEKNFVTFFSKHNQKHEGLSFKLLITDSETTTLYV